MLGLLKTMEQDDCLIVTHVKPNLVLVYQNNYLAESTSATIQEFLELAREYPDSILVNSEYTVYPPNYPRPLLNINFAIG